VNLAGTAGLEPASVRVTGGCSALNYMPLAHRDGIEPSSRRSSAGRSTSELPVQIWSTRSDSNTRPHAYQTCALPTELLVFGSRPRIRTGKHLCLRQAGMPSSRQTAKVWIGHDPEKTGQAHTRAAGSVSTAVSGHCPIILTIRIVKEQMIGAIKKP
jgi:hypothetical protein